MFSDKLAIVVRDLLRSSNLFLEGNNNRIHVSPNGRPFPTSGTWFVGIHAITLNPDLSVEFLRFYTSYEIIISRRSRPIPQESLDTIYLEMIDIAERAIIILDRNTNILTNLQTSITYADKPVSIYGRNLYQRMDSLPMEKDFKWWFADGDHSGVDPSTKVRISGYTLGINFFGPTIAISNQCTTITPG